MLIRDGISPGTASWRIKLLDEETRTWFVRFCAEFKHGQGARYQDLGDGWLRMSAHLVNEFLCKKDYHTNWHIEVHEEYGALTLDGWRAALEKAGLRVLCLREYAAEWIVEHRYRGHVELADDSGRPLAWPATNAIIVGEKP